MLTLFFFYPFSASCGPRDFKQGQADCVETRKNLDQAAFNPALSNVVSLETQDLQPQVRNERPLLL